MNGFAKRNIGNGVYGGIGLHASIAGPNKLGLVIPSNREQDRALILTKDWKSLKDYYPARNGSFYFYGAPGKEVGKYIILEKDGVKHIFHNLNGKFKSKNALYVLDQGFDGKVPLVDSIADSGGKEIHYLITVDGEKCVYALDLPEKRDREGAILSVENFGQNLDKLIDTSISLKRLYGFWWEPTRFF